MGKQRDGDDVNKVASIADRGFKGSDKGRGHGDEPPWYSDLSLSKDGNFKATVHNVMTVLENHPDWQGVFALDSFANKIVKRRESPAGDSAREFQDVDGTEVAAWFGDPANGLDINISKSLALDSVEAIATRHAFHPVRDYLDTLKWDRRRRVPFMFADYFGMEYNAYTHRCAINLMVSAIARIYDPGCQVDFMLIFEGKQGIRKSSAIRTLFTPQWFVEASESPYNKDFYLNMRGHWCIEIAEMQAFSKAEANKVKQSVSTRVDSYRPPYGRHVQSFPRQSIFIGTTNDEYYLRDPTGARRFLPLRSTGVNIDGLQAERDQLWAEAMTRYRRGQPYWHLPAEAESEQDLRYQADSWEEPIRDWLDGNAPDAAYPADMAGQIDEATTTEIMTHALRLDIGKHTRQDQMRVGAIMKRLGWERRRKRDVGEENGKLKYTYQRIEGNSS